MQSDCLYSSLFFERYNCIYFVGECLNVTVLFVRYGVVCSFEGMSSHNTFVVYLALTNVDSASYCGSSVYQVLRLSEK